MGLPLMSQSALSPEQRRLYDNGIEANFKGFIATDEAGRLIGPVESLAHFPKFGRPVWELVKSLSAAPKLPRPVRKIAILVAERISIPLIHYRTFHAAQRVSFELVPGLSKCGRISLS